MRTTLLGGIAIVVLAGGCAAMHKQTVENMKRNGDPRAPCYEACSPSDLACLKECDNKHPLAGTIFQGAATSGGGGGGGGGEGAAPPGSEPPAQPPPSGVTAEQVEMLTAAALQDAARRKAASTSTPSSSTTSSFSSSSSSSTSRSSSSSSQSKSRTPSSSTDCNPSCGAGQKCVVYLEGSKQCAPGGKCWTVDRTHAECK